MASQCASRMHTVTCFELLKCLAQGACRRTGGRLQGLGRGIQRVPVVVDVMTAVTCPKGQRRLQRHEVLEGVLAFWHPRVGVAPCAKVVAPCARGSAMR